MWQLPTINFQFKWYDLWIGAYWDRSQRVLYLCPFPMCVIVIARHGSGLVGPLSSNLCPKHRRRLRADGKCTVCWLESIIIDKKGVIHD